MCLRSCHHLRIDNPCPECATEYESEVNPRSERNRLLAAADTQAEITPATDREWRAWREENTVAAKAFAEAN